MQNEVNCTEQNQGKRRVYVSDVMGTDALVNGKLNLIVAPCGSGKTYFVENKLKRANKNPEQDMLYLTPTRSLMRAFNHRGKYIEEVLPTGELIEVKKQDGVTAMTYAKFGKMIFDAKESGNYENSRFWNDHSLICLDELSQAVMQSVYDNDAPINYTNYALDELARRIENESNTVVTVSATPRVGARRFDIFRIKPFNLLDKVTGYENHHEEGYYEIDNLLKIINPTEKGLIYVRRIRTMEKLVEKLTEKGIKAVGIFSEKSKAHRMTREQGKVARIVVEEERIPEDVQVLLINAAYETGLNIRPELSRLDYIIVHDANEDTRIQARGRYRGDLDRLYYREKVNDAEREIPHEVIAPYLSRKLTPEDTDELCEKLNFRHKNGTLAKWKKVRKELEAKGYTLTYKRSGNKRLWIIEE